MVRNTPLPTPCLEISDVDDYAAGAVDFEFLDDADLKKQLMEEWAFLKPAEPVTELFRIKTGEAFFWTMADFLKEQEIARVKF